MKRILEAIRDPERRRVFYAILGSKAIALAVLFLVLKGIPDYFSHPALADDAAAPPAPYINPINTMWTLIAAFLVFFMQAGFMMLEAGFARTRETVNILLEGIVDTCLCGILFWAWGFAFMFGSGNGFIGHQYFFLHGAPATYGTTGVPILAFWLFQFAFADTCSTITSGAMVGRTGFVGDLLYSFGVSAASSTRSSATGPGVRTAGSTPSSRPRSTTSPARRSFTRSAASSRSPAPSRSDRASAASSSVTAAACRPATT